MAPTMSSPSDNLIIGQTKDIEQQVSEHSDVRNGDEYIIADKLARKLSARQVQMIAIGKVNKIRSSKKSLD